MDIFDYVIIILLLLYAVNFQGHFEQIGEVILLVAGAGTILKRYIKKSWQDLFVVLFLIVYFLKVNVFLGENIYMKVLQYIGLYLFGAFLCEYCLGKNKHDLLFKFIFWGTVGFGVYGVLCTFKMGIIGANQRVGDFWSQSDVIASTQVSAWIVTFLAIVPWVVLQFKEVRFAYKAVTIILGALSVISVFVLASRTSLLVVVLAVILTLYCLVEGKQRKVLTRIVILLCIAFIAYQMNIGGIQDKLLGSNLVVRLLTKAENGGAFQTSRTTRWLYVLTHWGECLTGNYYFSSRIGGQIHSSLLDLYDQAGMLPFLLFMIIVFRLVYTLCMIRKVDSDWIFEKGIQIWFVLMAFVLLTEPIWYYGRSHYVAFTFFMFSVVEHYWLWEKGKVTESDE